MKSFPSDNNKSSNLVIATNANSGTQRLIADLKEFALPAVQSGFTAPFDFIFQRSFAKLAIWAGGGIVLIFGLRWLLVSAPKVFLKCISFPLFISGWIIAWMMQCYGWIAEQPWVGLLLLALLAVPMGILLAWAKPFEPYSITLNSDNICCYWKIVFFNIKKQLIWSDVSSVVLLKPSARSSTDSWSVLFCSASNPKASMKVRLSGLGDYNDRKLIIDALDHWAPQATRDPELLEAFTPVDEGSYTELWLQSLASPPRRDRLKPLTLGTPLQNGKYCVLEQLGAGGQGVAYLASVRYCEDPIVLKESILPIYLDIDVRKAALEKFAREAEMLKKLDHPQIVKLIDYFVEDHRGYLVLEHIRGLNLRSLIASNGPLSESRTLELAKQMVPILFYLHAQSPPVVHRDFTPDNLILNTSGELKLIDFTVAEQSGKLKASTVVGKASYMPPEQLRGRATSQSDIYAMGASLFYLLTAEDPTPLSSSSPNLLRSKLVSTEMNELIMKATSLDTEDRFKSAAEIQEVLNALTTNSERERS